MTVLQQILKLDGHIQSIYLAIYKDKILLLDGCSRADVGLILDTIRHILGRPITDLKVVMVTHMHSDHAGAATYLKKLTGCLIVSAEKPKQWYAGIGGRVMYTIDTSLAYYVANRLGKPIKNLWYPRELHPDIIVKDADTIPFFTDWQVLETPGHTDRDLSFYHKQTGKVYVADLLIKLKHKFVYPFPIYQPNIYRQSLLKVAQLSPKLVMMAHGGQMNISQDLLFELANKSPLHTRTVKDTIKHKLMFKKKK